MAQRPQQSKTARFSRTHFKILRVDVSPGPLSSMLVFLIKQRPRLTLEVEAGYIWLQSFNPPLVREAPTWNKYSWFYWSVALTPFWFCCVRLRKLNLNQD